MPGPSAKPQGGERRAAAGYEPKDANAKWIFGIVFFLLISGIGIHFILSWMMGGLERTPTPTDRWADAKVHRVTTQQTVASFPQLQISPAEDLKQFRTVEDLDLNTYGWVNRTAGVVRIPIERAMDLALQRGFPISDGTNGLKLGPSSYELQQQRPTAAVKEVGK